MDNIDKLKKLKARLEKAEGGDLSIDRAIRELLDFSHRVLGYPYTSSTDAALGLANRVLPNYAIQIFQSDTPKNAYWEVVFMFDKGDGPEMTMHDEFGPTLPIAILIALMSALIEREENDTIQNHDGKAKAQSTKETSR